MSGDVGVPGGSEPSSPKPLMVFEEIGPDATRVVAHLFGVEWRATPGAFGMILGRALLTAVVVGAVFPGTLVERVLAGVAVSLAIEASVFVHSIGHIAGGFLVGAPMDANVITGTRQINVYDGEPEDPTVLPPRVHLGRSLGGPVANLLLGALSLAFLLTGRAAWLPSFWPPPFGDFELVAGYVADVLGALGPIGLMLATLAAVNLVGGLIGLLPIRSVDGEVVWREIARLV